MHLTTCSDIQHLKEFPMEIGSRIPSTQVQQLVEGEIRQVDLAEFSAGRTIVLVAVPGAFTPTCSDAHVPGYIENMQVFLDCGVDEIVILAPNDFFVVKAWGDQWKAPRNVHFVADGSQLFTADVDQLLDLTDLGLGMRSRRYAAVIRDGIIVSCATEPDAAAVSVSGAESVLANL
jgi:peroxiredoxin